MTNKIQVGDLVCLHRRKRKGVGVVLKRSIDIFDPLGINLEEILSKECPTQRDRLDNIVHTLNSLNKIHGLNTPEDSKQLLDSIYLFNTGWSGKLKTNFVYICWLKKPSNYEVSVIRNDLGWFPSEWVKILKTDNKVLQK